jgi:hypothetical protein
VVGTLHDQDGYRMIRSALIGSLVDADEHSQLLSIALQHPGLWHDRLCHWHRLLDAACTTESQLELGSSSSCVKQSGGTLKDIKNLTGDLKSINPHLSEHHIRTETKARLTAVCMTSFGLPMPSRYAISRVMLEYGRSEKAPKKATQSLEDALGLYEAAFSVVGGAGEVTQAAAAVTAATAAVTSAKNARTDAHIKVMDLQDENRPKAKPDPAFAFPKHLNESLDTHLALCSAAIGASIYDKHIAPAMTRALASETCQRVPCGYATNLDPESTGPCPFSTPGSGFTDKEKKKYNMHIAEHMEKAHQRAAPRQAVAEGGAAAVGDAGMVESFFSDSEGDTGAYSGVDGKYDFNNIFLFHGKPHTDEY